jgi:uncharacterized protein (DUF362 family)
MDRCEDLLYREAPRKSDREVITYVRAHDFAKRGEYKHAIDVFNFLPADSSLVGSRPRIVAAWARKLKEQQAKAAVQAGKAGGNKSVVQPKGKPEAANSKTNSVTAINK